MVVMVRMCVHVRVYIYVIACKSDGFPISKEMKMTNQFANGIQMNNLHLLN